MEAHIESCGYGPRVRLSLSQRVALEGISERDNGKPVQHLLAALSIPRNHPDSSDGFYTIVAEVAFADGTGAIYGFAPQPIRAVGRTRVGGGWHCFMN